MSRKGFVLLDTLICVIIIYETCNMVFMIYQSIDAYQKGYVNYQENSNSNLVYYFNSLYECEGCNIDGS